MKTPNSYTFRSSNAAIQYKEEVDDHDSDENENGNYDDSKRHPKKRKLESFVSAYESGSRRENWSEEESFALLEVWGERYMELGRRSLRAEDWVEVSEKVVDRNRCRRERTEGECRNQLDALKNRYKKERAKVESKWAFFKKMDALLSTRTRGFCGLGCGLDSGEYVFMNPRVYLDRSNVLDEMRDSPAESDEEEDNGEDDLGEEEEDDARVLADSIHKFGEIYEKMEESKRKQMVELETMRQDFQRELELQKKHIVDRAEAEIAKIREMDDDDDDDDDNDEEEEEVEENGDGDGDDDDDGDNGDDDGDNGDGDTDTSVEHFGD